MQADRPSIILTSFHRSKKMEGQKFSICRFQPSGIMYPELRFLAAEDDNGQKLPLPGKDEADRFAAQYKKAIVSRWGQVREWLDGISSEGGPVILLCWCPFSEGTRDLVKAGESFLCHSGLVGKLVNKYRPDVRLCLDEDREAWLDARWKPSDYEEVNSLGVVEKQQSLFNLRYPQYVVDE